MVMTPAGPEVGEFTAALADLPSKKVAEHLLAIIGVLLEYAAPDIGAEQQRLTIADAISSLDPMPFDMRLEPQTSFASALCEFAEHRPIVLREALIHIFRQQRASLSGAELLLLVSVLVESQVGLPDEITFLAVENLTALHDPAMAIDVAGLLPSLLSGDGSASISLLERLGAVGLMSLQPVFAALQRVSQYDPARLGPTFALCEPEFATDAAAEALEDGSIRFLLGDLIDRAGPITVLEAMFHCEPRSAPALFKAAFAGINVPYQLVKRVHETDDRLQVIAGERRFALSSLRRPELDDAWLSRLKVVGEIIVITEIVNSRRSPMTELFARIMNHPTLLTENG